MISSQAPNLQVSHQWANPNPALSMDTVTINQSGAMSNLPRASSSRQQQPNRGSSYPHRVEHNSCENNPLPQLSMRDLQCLDTVPQATAINQSDSQPIFHVPQVRDELTSETRAQNHLGNQNQGLQTMWSSFSTHNTSQNTYNGSVPGGGGGSQGLGSYPFLEGMEGDDFIRSITGGGFQLKQEPQMTVVQETHASLMQSPRESQGNTYTNLLPRPMSNGSNMDPMRQDGSSNSQVLKNLQNPYSNNGMAPEAHFKNLTDWLKAPQQSD